MNTNTTKLNLEITGEVTRNGSTIYSCIFMCAGRSNNIVLTTGTIDYDGIKQALSYDLEHDDFLEFMDIDSSIEVEDAADFKAIEAVTSNLPYLRKELSELNIQQLGLAAWKAQEEILEEIAK